MTGSPAPGFVFVGAGHVDGGFDERRLAGETEHEREGAIGSGCIVAVEGGESAAFIELLARLPDPGLAAGRVGV